MPSTYRSHMSGSRFVVVVATALMLAAPGATRADTVHYVLAPESRIAAICRGCEGGASDPEPLAGSFDLTAMPVAMTNAIEALTAIDWRSPTLSVTGSGFLQRLGTDRMAMVVDARINGTSALLTSGRRQKASPNEIRIHLSSAKEDGGGYTLTIGAVPEVAAGPDGDGDGVADAADSCPQTASTDQADGDRDGIGNACDACPDTPPGSLIVPSGCSLVQECPCSGPAPDEEWESPRAYVQCVARHLKQLRRQGKVGRAEIRVLLQDAVRSGCGGQVVALN